MDTSVGADDVEAVWSRLQKAMTDPDGLQNPYPLLREMHRYGDRVRTPGAAHAAEIDQKSVPPSIFRMAPLT